MLKSYDEMTADQKLAYKMGREAERARWDDPDEVRAAVVPLLDLEAAAIRYYEGDEIRPGPPHWDDCIDGMKRWYRDESKAVVYAALGLLEPTNHGGSDV